jgi:DNA mismatch repair protein MutL
LAGPSAIGVLDTHTINQIAAGEVVERPASVVKELFENALDAGARRVEITVRDAGRSLIEVRDDGTGMNPEDARAALERHATSKIRAVADLVSVRTYGFRGEALPSIAGVARMTVRTEDTAGRVTVLRADGGRVRAASGESAAGVAGRLAPAPGDVFAPEPAPEGFGGGRSGTVVRVEDLFYNVPARRKFLKSDAAELGQIIDHVARLAVARPDVAVRLRHGGHEVLSTPGRSEGSADRRAAVAEVWGRETARALVEIDAEAAGIQFRGWVSPPELTKANRAFQYVSVNGRPVRARTLTAAVDQAFRDLTPERRFPLLVLDIALDPARVDVNVSPTKSEVRFLEEGAVFAAVRHALKQALLAHGMVPSAAAVARANAAAAVHAWQMVERREGGTAGFDFAVIGASGAVSLGAGSLGAVSLEAVSPGPLSLGPDSVGSSSLGTKSLGTGSDGSDDSDKGARTLGPDATSHEPESAARPFGHLMSGLRVLGQLARTYIVAETPRGLAIIDQHVAHERVLFERLARERGGGPGDVQPLLVPQVLELDRRSAAVLRERLDEIAAAGFAVEPFGGDGFVVRAVPVALRGRDPRRFLRELAEDLAENHDAARRPPTREQVWITASCRMAVKAGDVLSLTEMEALLRQLAETENPYLCPHGRPITVTLDLAQLNALFKRT